MGNLVSNPEGEKWQPRYRAWFPTSVRDGEVRTRSHQQGNRTLGLMWKQRKKKERRERIKVENNKTYFWIDLKLLIQTSEVFGIP